MYIYIYVNVYIHRHSLYIYIYVISFRQLPHQRLPGSHTSFGHRSSEVELGNELALRYNDKPGMSSPGGKHGVIFQAISKQENHGRAVEIDREQWNMMEDDGTWGIWHEFSFNSRIGGAGRITLMLFVRKWTCIILHRGSSQWHFFHVTGAKSCHCTGFLGKDMWILMASLVFRAYWWYFLKHRNWRSQNISEVLWIGTFVSKEIPATLGRFLVTR